MTRQARQASSETAVTRFAHALAFARYLDMQGLSVERQLAGAGLPGLGDDPDEMVPVLNVWSFFDTMSEEGMPSLGWQVGLGIGESFLSGAMLGRLSAAPTPHRAVVQLIEHVCSESSDIRMGQLSQSGQIIYFSHYPDLRGAPGYLQSQAYQICVFLAIARHFLGREWVPEFVGQEGMGAGADLKNLMPGTTLHTQQSAGFLAIPKQLLARTGTVDERPVEKRSFSAILKRRLVDEISDGYVSQSVAAEMMETSVRTLSRRLADEHCTYGTLLDDVRFVVASRVLLENGAMVRDAASAVGFSDQGDFTRMFKRVSGVTPAEYRRAHFEDGPD